MTPDQKISNSSWNILIVDDKKDIHPITKNVFFEEEILDREINFLSAITEKEAINILNKYHSKIAVIILDMALEHNGDEGINVLNHLVNELNNNWTQVILRTGYPGKVEVKNINIDFPQVVILEKGETNEAYLIQLVSESITKFNRF